VFALATDFSICAYSSFLAGVVQARVYLWLNRDGLCCLSITSTAESCILPAALLLYLSSFSRIQGKIGQSNAESLSSPITM
jgi:hypothetical protein